MTNQSALVEISGIEALVGWFGYMPHFHDAELLELSLRSNGTSTMRIYTWQITDRLDAQRYYIYDKHVVVTVTLEEVTLVNLKDFHLPGIIFDLEISKGEEDFGLTWYGSYGVEGSIRAKKVRFDLLPGKP